MKDFLERLLTPGQWAVALAGICFVGSSLMAQDRLINTEQGDPQESTSLAPLANGGVVFVWSDRGVDMRRFDSSGRALDPQDVDVDPGSTSLRKQSEVASSGSGEFVVVWTDYYFDGLATSEVRARRFLDDGNALGPAFQVNVETYLSQALPAVAMGPDGSFMVAWNDGSADGAGAGISARRFDSNGDPQLGELLVNTTTAGDQTSPDIALDQAGEALIVWASDSIMMRRFDSAGLPVAGEMVVSEQPLPVPAMIGVGPTVAIAPEGSFVVSWLAQGTSASNDLFARIFDAAGNPLASELTLDSAAHFNSEPAVLAVAGEFQVYWHREGANGLDVVSQRISSVGEPIGDVSIATSMVAGSQRLPEAIALGDETIAVWSAVDEDSDGVFSNFAAPPEIFSDDFESGQLGAWSDTFP